MLCNWLIIFNLFDMFIVMQWLEYAIPEFILALDDPPSPASVLIIKYTVVLFFIFIYKLISILFSRIAKALIPLMDIRKYTVHDEHFLKKQKN